MKAQLKEDIRMYYPENTFPGTSKQYKKFVKFAKRNIKKYWLSELFDLWSKRHKLFFYS